MHGLNPRNPELLKSARYALKTDVDAIRGFKKNIVAKRQVVARKFVVTRHPEVFTYVGTNEKVAKIFATIGERKIARAISVELINSKTTFRMDICLSVLRMFRGISIDIGGRKAVVTNGLVQSVLKRLIQKKLVKVKSSI